MSTQNLEDLLEELEELEIQTKAEAARTGMSEQQVLVKGLKEQQDLHMQHHCQWGPWEPLDSDEMAWAVNDVSDGDVTEDAKYVWEMTEERGRSCLCGCFMDGFLPNNAPSVTEAERVEVLRRWYLDGTLGQLGLANHPLLLDKIFDLSDPI